MPIFTSSAEAAPAISAQAETASMSFFIYCISLFGSKSCADRSAPLSKREAIFCRHHVDEIPTCEST
jgi:hypothetical protein